MQHPRDRIALVSPLGLWLCGAAGLLVLTCVTYRAAFWNDFVEFDDNIYVTQNPITKGGLSTTGFRYAWTTFDSGNWIPLTWLSYQLDASLYGDGPHGFHFTSIILHGLNVILLFGWLLQTTRARWLSLIAAALFAIHPLHVESVAWIAERKDVLSAFWMFASLLAYAQYVRSRNGIWYFATAAMFVCGLLSKSMLVTFPLLLLLVDYWPLGRFFSAELSVDDRKPRTFRQLLVEKIPLLACSIVDGLVTITAQDAGHAVGNEMAGTALGNLPWMIRISNAIQSYAWYLAKTIWPKSLCVFYPHPLNAVDLTHTLMSLALLSVMSLYVLWIGKRRPYLLFGWLWFLISLLPVIGLIQIGSQAHADRYSYIPHVGLIVLLVWECDYWLKHDRFRSAAKSGLKSISHPARWLIMPFVFCVICWLSVLTAEQVKVWRDTKTLWQHALTVDPNNWFAHLQIGNRRVLFDQPDEEALKHFQVVLKSNPEHVIALNNVGWIYQCREDWATAEQFYRRALRVDPGFESAVHNLVVVLKSQNRLIEGADQLKAYSQRHPTDARILNELGLIDVRTGQFESAQRRFAAAVHAAPDFINARYNLALALLHLGREQEAKSELETLLQHAPHHANAHLNLGILFEKSGQLEQARQHYQATLLENPNDAEARNRLQTLMQHAGSP